MTWSCGLSGCAGVSHRIRNSLMNEMKEGEGFGKNRNDGYLKKRVKDWQDGSSVI